MDGSTTAERVKIIKTCENIDYVLGTLRALWANYGRHNRPSDRTVNQPLKKFSKTGFVTNLCVNHRNASLTEYIDGVSLSVKKNTNLSITRHVYHSGLANGILWHILQFEFASSSLGWRRWKNWNRLTMQCVEDALIGYSNKSIWMSIFCFKSSLAVRLIFCLTDMSTSKIFTSVAVKTDKRQSKTVAFPKTHYMVWCLIQRNGRNALTNFENDNYFWLLQPHHYQFFYA